MKILFFIFFSFFALFQFQYIYPYKHSDFVLSYNSKSIPNLEYTLTFQVDIEVSPYNYFILDFSNSFNSPFENGFLSKVYDCDLGIFQESSGKYFSEKDLEISSSSSQIQSNLLYSCQEFNGRAVFLPNTTLFKEIVYQLKFKIETPISKNFKDPFFVTLYISEKKELSGLIWASNLDYALFAPVTLRENVPGLQAGMRPIYITSDMESNFFQVLNRSLDTYENAFFKKQSLGVSFFNQMIQNLNYKKKIVYEENSLTVNSVFETDFLGNFIIDIPAANLGIQAFSLFETVFPDAVTLNQTTTKCISIEFKDYYDTSKVATYFEHTNCKIDGNRVSFYNVFDIPNVNIRIMITDVKNPSLPGNHEAYLKVSSPAKKIVYFKQVLNIPIQSHSLVIKLDNTIQSPLEKTNFFNENVQSMKLTFSLIYSDILNESMMELTFNSEYSVPFGNDCVIVNPGTWYNYSRNIECQVDKITSKIRVKYIPFLYDSNNYTLFFFMKNVKQGATKLVVNVYPLNQKENIYYANPSLSNKIDYTIENVGLNMKEIYFLDADNNKIFNTNSVLANELKIKFSLPSDTNYQSKAGDNIKLLMNPLIERDSVQDCSIEELSLVIPCDFSNEIGSVIFINLPEGIASLFTGEDFTLSIKGLNYNKVYESPYKFSFEYYLVYTLSDQSKTYIGMNKAQIPLPALDSPENQNIVLVGGLSSTSIPKSLIKAKLFSPRLYELDPVKIKATNFQNLKVHLYLRNFDIADFKNEEPIFFQKAGESIIKSFFTLAVNEESEDFREWAIVKFYDVQLYDGDQPVQIPLMNLKNKQGEAVVVFYVNVDGEYFLPFDQYKLNVRGKVASAELDFLGDIKINWEESASSGPIPQDSLFEAYFNFKFDEKTFANVKTSKTIFVLFYFNWNLVDSDLPISCEGDSAFAGNNLQETISIFNETSKTFLIFQIEGFENIADSEFEGNLICSDVKAPYAPDPNNLYSAFISDKDGNIINGKMPSQIKTDFKFAAIQLLFKKTRFTPNVLKAPSSHLALYFMSDTPLSFPGSFKLIIPSEFEISILNVEKSLNSNLLTKTYLSLLQTASIEIKLLNNFLDYDLYGIEDNSFFEFDTYEYKTKPITSLPSYIQETIKLDITYVESLIQNEKNSQDLVIKINVNSNFKITREHLLLLEVFNLRTPTDAQKIILKMEFELEDNKPIALGEIEHEFTLESTNPSFSVTGSPIFSMKDFIQPYFSVEIIFKDIIFPNYVFVLTVPDDFVENNSQEKNALFSFKAECQNLDVTVALTEDGVQPLNQFPTRLLQGETSVDNSIDNSTNSSNVDPTNSDSLNSSVSELFDLSSTVSTEPKTIKYKKPYITKKEKGKFLVAVEPPSLSRRSLKLNFLNFWADSTKDLELTINLHTNYEINTNEKIFSQTVKSESFPISQQEIIIEDISNDLEIPNVESDFSIKITPSFDFLGKAFFLFLSFGEGIILRDDYKFYIDGKQYQGLVEGSTSVMMTFKYSRNFGRSLVLSIPYLKKPHSAIDDKKEFLVSMVCIDNKANDASQTKLLMRKSQIIDQKPSIIITDIRLSDLKTYNTADIIFSIRYQTSLAIAINDVFRFFFPKDFPAAYEYEASNKCEIKICEDETFKICSLIDSLCNMIENHVNLVFKKELAPKGTENSEIFANITIFRIKTSPFYGKIGAISVFHYSSLIMEIKGKNSPTSDQYVYPVLIQYLYSVCHVTNPESTDDVAIVNVLKGTIKRIFLKDFLGLGFRNEMSVDIKITGNDQITFFGANEKPYTKTIMIKNGELMKYFDLKIDKTSDFYFADLRFSMSSMILKYQDIQPLQIRILDENIKISIVSNIIMTKGISSFLSITLSETPVDPVTIIITPSSPDIIILGGNQIKFNSSYTAHSFRIRSKINGNLAYSLPPDLYEFVGALSFSTISVTNPNDALIANTLTFTPIFTSGVGSITINAILDTYKAFLYYQIFDVIKNVAEIPNYKIVQSLENLNLMKMNLEGSIIGVKECNVTKVICKTKIDGLDVSSYKIKAFMVSYNNITSSSIVIKINEVLTLRPLVMDFALSNDLTHNQKNNFLCSLSEFLGLNPLSIYSEDDANCNFNAFTNEKSAALTSSFIEESVLLLNSSSLPIDNLDVNKLKNLRPSVIQNLFLNRQKMLDLEQDSLSSSLKIYIYSSSESPDFNLTLYSQKFEDLTTSAYFKSIFPQIDFDFFLKSSSVLGKTNSINSFLPILVGTPLISVDVNSIKITIELSDQAVVFGVAVLANATKPTSSQIAQGMNSDGVIGNNCTVENNLDKNGGLNPISLVFKNLKTNTNYNFYFVVGLYIPGKDIIGSTIYNVRATPIDPFKKIGSRILNFENA